MGRSLVPRSEISLLSRSTGGVCGRNHEVGAEQSREEEGGERREEQKSGGREERGGGIRDVGESR
eukprot:766885-Hanusia_phi.AAC.4